MGETKLQSRSDYDEGKPGHQEGQQPREGASLPPLKAVFSMKVTLKSDSTAELYKWERSADIDDTMTPLKPIDCQIVTHIVPASSWNE